MLAQGIKQCRAGVDRQGVRATIDLKVEGHGRRRRLGIGRAGTQRKTRVADETEGACGGSGLQNPASRQLKSCVRVLTHRCS
jgi:hypothetical protein